MDQIDVQSKKNGCGMAQEKKTRRDASVDILVRLDKGPASPKKLEDELYLGHSTVNHVLKHSTLAKAGIIKQLSDGRYALKWFEENDVENAYHKLERMFGRSPTPLEFAGFVKKHPNEARDLLLKNIFNYHEPREEDIILAANNLWKMVIGYAWRERGLPSSKKYWFDEGIKKVVIVGMDCETVGEILKGRYQGNNDEVREYLNEFSMMRPEIASERANDEIKYRITCPDELKNALHPLRPYSQTMEIRIPLRPISDRDPFWNVQENGFESIINFAEVFSPDARIIDSLLSFVGTVYDGPEFLKALKKFCQNGLEVEQIDRDTKDKIISALLGKAFKFDDWGGNERKKDEHLPANMRKISKEDREVAFDIIRMLNVREGPGFAAAMRYIRDSMSLKMNDRLEGPDFLQVASWLAEDSKTKLELINMAEEILACACDEMDSVNSRCLINHLLSQ